MPYIHVPTLFGIIQPFGVLIACAVLLGTFMGRRYAELNRMDEEMWRYLGIRLLIFGWIGCHLFNVFFYEWDRLWGIGRHEKQDFDWLMLINPFDGISSWGGIVGGTIAFLIYARKRALDRLRWADLLSWAAIGGWVPGRAACAVVHDHTGGPTDFVLGIQVPPLAELPGDTPGLVARYAGQRIHDLGLYETLILIPIFGIMILAERIPSRKPGLMMGLLAVLYSAPRFFLDFLRLESTDPRYAGLTFAQWCCIVAFLFGVTLLVRPRDRASTLATDDPEKTVPARPSARSRAKGGPGAKRQGRGR